jgi:hypothetical protein
MESSGGKTPFLSYLGKEASVHHRRLTLLAAASLAVFGVTGCSTPDYEKWEANLDGGQENPPVTTSAAGHAVLLVSQDGQRVDLTVELTQPLTGTLTLAHIHKNVRGQNGGVIHNIWVPNVTTTEPFEVGKPIGRTFTFTPENLADLRAGMYYVNVHSSFKGGGEIRGQLERTQ